MASDVSPEVRRAAPETDGLEPPRRHWATLGILLSIVVVVLDASMANVALPSIARSLSIDPADVVWVPMAYNLIVVVSLLPLSAVAERIGFRRVYVAGMVVFALASVAAANAGSLSFLITARVFQGIGASMLMCLFGGLVRNIYPTRLLATGLSLNAMTVGLMAVLGPSIGALLLEVASWPWIFLVSLPFAALAIPCARHLPDVPRTASRFDWFACALSMPAFGLLLLGMDALVRQPLTAAACLATSCLCLWLLLRRSRQQTAPLVPVDLLRSVPVAFAVGASFFSFAAQMAALVTLPFYLQDTLGFGYGDVGILLGAWAIGVAAMAPAAAFLSGRLPIAVLCGIGAAAMAAGMASLLFMQSGIAFAWLFVAMLTSGIGFGFFQTPNNRALLSGAPRHRSGAAGGLQSLTRVLGQGFGTALISVAFGISQGRGPTFGVLVSVACALLALGINVVRQLNPAPDVPPS